MLERLGKEIGLFFQIYDDYKDGEVGQKFALTEMKKSKDNILYCVQDLVLIDREPLVEWLCYLFKKTEV